MNQIRNINVLLGNKYETSVIFSNLILKYFTTKGYLQYSNKFILYNKKLYV